jgi:hypothetical protein
MTRAHLSCRFAAFACAVATASIGAVARAGDSEPLTAYVYDYHGPAKAFVISRGNGTVSLYPILPLLADDRVSVVHPTDAKGNPNTLTLSIDGTLHTLGEINGTAHLGPWCVGYVGGSCDGGAPRVPVSSKSAAILSVLQRVIGSIGTELSQAKEDYDSEESAPLASRGAAGPPSLPILRTTPLAAVAAGPTALAIPISGGTPPFQVRLYAANGAQPIAQSQVTSGNEARLPLVTLAQGKFRVTIGDAENANVSEAFDAVDPADVPQPPDPGLELAMKADQAFVRDAAITGYAAYLQQRGPRWYLTAYQELQTTSPDFPAGKALRFRLGEGP